MSDTCLEFTLSEVVDQLMIRQLNFKRKYYKAYLSVSQDVWKKCFWNTLWTVKNQWLEIQQPGPDDPYPFVYKPKNCLRFLALSTTDECGEDVPLYYNSMLNTIKKPDKRKCECDKCGGNAMRDQVEGFDVTTSPVVIGGVTYYEKTWLKYCSNGDILEYREIPTQKFNSIQQSGDYNDDYNSDYNVASSFQDFQVVTVIQQKKICTLQTKPCGCPIDNEDNRKNLIGCCGCHIRWWRHHKFCDTFLEKINYNERGEIKFSECGTKIYIRQHRCTPEFLKTKRFAKIKFQTNGINIGEDILVPDYARDFMWSGIDVSMKEYNNRFSINEKTDAKWRHEEKENDLILFLNPLPMEMLSNVQDAFIRW